MGFELRMRSMHLGLLLLCAPCRTYDALAPGGDRVLFHHEFDTAWRPSFWHNYHGRGELGAVGDL